MEFTVVYALNTVNQSTKKKIEIYLPEEYLNIVDKNDKAFPFSLFCSPNNSHKASAFGLAGHMMPSGRQCLHSPHNP
jgi:hypothetical protein